MAFGSGSRMGDRAFIGRADILRIAPQCARTVIVGSRLPVRTTLGENSLADIEVDRAVDRVDTDRIAVLDQRDRAPLSRFGADMADAEATRAARKTAVGDERDLFAHPLPVERGGGRQHLTHTGATLGAFVTDQDRKSTRLNSSH